MPHIRNSSRTALFTGIFATLVLVVPMALTAPKAAASPTTPPKPSHSSVATAPVGSTARRPYVAEARRQATTPVPAPTGRWAHASTPVPVCGPPAPGHVACLAIARSVRSHFSRGKSPAVNSPGTGFEGYQPADIQAAYGTTGETKAPLVAIIDFNDDPQAETALGQYRSTFGLPACTTANGCFTKVNQNGKATPLPPQDPTGGSNGEISLDLDSVSAACPHCHILLVEANSGSFADTDTAADQAVTLGAKYVSMSFGAAEGAIIDAADGGTVAQAKAAVQQFDTTFTKAGVTFVASSGDDAFRFDATHEPLGGIEYPSSSPDVVSAGGVSLNRNATSGVFSDTAWSWDPTSIGCKYTQSFDTTGDRCAGAGSGCSQLEPAQPWQQGDVKVSAVCPAGRASADVSADANPNTGLLVDVDGSAFLIGGTSLAAPLLTSLYALTGEVSGSESGAVQSRAYSNPAGLVDVTSGATGSCSSSALCTAGAGWDGPTGLGAPNAPADLNPTLVNPTLSAVWPTFRYGTASTVKVTVSATKAPTGRVTLKYGNTVLASAALAGSGTARTASVVVPATKLAAGSRALVAYYSGGGGVAQKRLASHTVNVAKATPTVTATWPASVDHTKAFSVKVTVTAPGGPTGAVSLKFGSTLLKSANLAAGTTTTKTITLTVAANKLSAGSRNLTVSYAGNANVAALTLAAHTEKVT